MSRARRAHRARRALVGLLTWYRERLARWLRLTLAVVWAVLIWVLSSSSGGGLPSGGFYSYLSNGAHVLIFGVLAGLIFLSTGGDMMARFRVSVISSMLYGALDEWHQSFVPGRCMDIWDLCSDTLGALLMGATLWWLVRPYPRPGRFLWPLLLLSAGSVAMAAS